MSFRTPPNWTAVAFFGGLGLLHLGIAATAMFSAKWDAHMSLVFGLIFCATSAAFLLVKHEVIVRADFRRLVVRTGLGKVAFERFIPFSRVVSVRVSLLNQAETHQPGVSIICADEDIDLPPVGTPRQQGLLLAMVMNVRLVKVYGDGASSLPAERIEQLYRNEDAV